MATLGQAKTLGGVGAILLILGFIPQTGGILAIAGLIMILIAVKYISDVLGDRSVFNNMMISVVMSIVAIVAVVVFVVGAFLAFYNLGSTPFTPNVTAASGFFAFLGVILIGLVVGWILLLVAAVFLRRSYDSISTRLNVGTFHTTGLLYLIGAATLIIGIGVIILIVAEILQIVAFFSIPEQMPMGPQPMPGQMGSPPPATR